MGSHPKLREQSFSRKCPTYRLGPTELESVEIGKTIVCVMKTAIVIAIVCGVEIGNRMKTETRVVFPKGVDWESSEA